MKKRVGFSQLEWKKKSSQCLQNVISRYLPSSEVLSGQVAKAHSTKITDQREGHKHNHEVECKDSHKDVENI